MYVNGLVARSRTDGRGPSLAGPGSAGMRVRQWSLDLASNTIASGDEAMRPSWGVRYWGRERVVEAT